MDLNSIRSALRKQPFEPFELRLADGRRVPVTHPEFVAMNNRVVIVIDDESFTRTIEPLLIVTLELLPSSGKGRNGSHKKRTKTLFLICVGENRTPRVAFHHTR